MKKYNSSPSEEINNLEQIQERTGHVFHDIDLLLTAMTHPSYAAEHTPPPEHYQRLEFLGDAVLQIIVSDYLYKHYPDRQEGALTKMRSSLTNEAATAAYAVDLGLDKALRLGHSEIDGGGRQRKSVLGDIFEAFLAAVYLDGGMEEASRICLALLVQTGAEERLAQQEECNPIGQLQEFTQSTFQCKPLYQLISHTGPVHAPLFTIGAFINGQYVSAATGKNHKQARSLAAEQALAFCADAASLPYLNGPAGAIFALDFDGVICNSAAETGCSGWKAAAALWPQDCPSPLPPQELLERFCALRPCLETGYQAIPMMRLLMDGVAVQEITASFSEQIQQCMAKHKLEKEELVRRFGNARDKWIGDNLEEWLAMHTFYPGVVDALKTALGAGLQIHILTTKQERFVQALLSGCGIQFPSNRLWGLDKHAPKENILQALRENTKATIHFVEDRLETLRRMERLHALESVRLYLADWGFVLPSSIEEAQNDSRLQVIALEEFTTMLKK